MRDAKRFDAIRPASNVGAPKEARKPGGLAGWLSQCLRPHTRTRPALVLLDRLTLAPRQTVSLIEADGKRLLIATSQTGNPAFYALDDHASRIPGSLAARNRTARISW